MVLTHSLITFNCKLDGRVHLLICSRKLCWMTNVSSTYLIHSLGGVGVVLSAFLSKCSMYRLSTMELTRDLIAAPTTCSLKWFWKEKYILCRQSTNNYIMCCNDNTVLWCNEVSSSSSPFMIISAGSTVTDVNNAVTSYEQIHSPSWRVT